MMTFDMRDVLLKTINEDVLDCDRLTILLPKSDGGVVKNGRWLNWGSVGGERFRMVGDFGENSAVGVKLGGSVFARRIIYDKFNVELTGTNR